jgi:hypothetical protein
MSKARSPKGKPATKSKGQPAKTPSLSRLPLAQLEAIALDNLKQADQAKGTLSTLGKSAAESVFKAGQALVALRDKLPQGHWKSWQREKGLGVGTVNEAVRLYERAGTLARVKGLSITEAKVRFRVIADPKVKAKRPPTPAQLVKRLERLQDSIEDCLGTLSTMLTPGGLGDIKPEAVAKILRSISDQSQQATEALVRLEGQAPEAK